MVVPPRRLFVVIVILLPDITPIAWVKCRGWHRSILVLAVLALRRQRRDGRMIVALPDVAAAARGRRRVCAAHRGRLDSSTLDPPPTLAAAPDAASNGKNK
jgi:hypothetical protein